MRILKQNLLAAGIVIFCLFQCRGLAGQNSLSVEQRVQQKIMEVPGLQNGRIVPLLPAGYMNRDAIRPGNSIPGFSSGMSLRPAAGNCPDSSFRKEILSGTLTHSFNTSAVTSGGGLLLGGFGRNIPDPPPYTFYGFLVKLDSAGRFLWATDLRANSNAAANIDQIREMSDGTIVVAGQFDNTASGEGNNFFTAKLSAAGTLIWIKTFKSPVLTCTSPGSMGTRMICQQISEGPGGDILFAGFLSDCSVSRYSIACRLSSTGVLQWSRAFKYPFSDGTGFGIAYEGGVAKFFVKAGGAYSGSDNTIHIDILRLDYNTGVLLSTKSWKPDLPYPASFVRSFTNQVYLQKLDNGNYAVYGELFGDWFQVAGVSYHFGVMELNSSDDFVNGYYISSPLTSNANGSSMLNLSPAGRLVYSFMNNYTGSSFRLFMGSVQEGNLLKQRMRFYNNLPPYGTDMWQQYRDGSYTLSKTLSDPAGNNFYVEFSRFHDSDTGSVCMGLDSSHASLTSLNYVPYNTSWTNEYPGALSATGNNSVQINPLLFTPGTICIQKNSCDSIRIHGAPSSCNLAQVFTFTSYRNSNCGARISWNINPAVTQVFQVVNDTTVRIQFNQNWQGWLYASINSSCGVLKDSVLISVLPSPGAVNLGPDRDLCTGNTILLNAHTGYASYLWNTGGTDSTVLVTTPGIYYVDVMDACGNRFSDTILVNAAPPVPLDLGPDRSLCKNDTLHINAPPGFINYTWGPAYFISSTTTQQVVVQPPVDTIYYVKAENAGGCFGYDTVRVQVKTAPPVQLGPDRDLCAGDSVILNAGPGFIQYNWSNGSAQQQTAVYGTGTFSVTAIAANGCRSADTIRILQLWPAPVLALNQDTALCAGTVRVLTPGSFAGYLWQDGSTGPFMNAAATGIYYVTVTDQHGCKGSDTTRIKWLQPLPADFLGKDTSVCQYGSVTLRPLKTFSSYLWSTGSQASSLSVSQPGTYWLQATDQFQCRGSDTITVSLKQCLTGFFIPTGFTPDNDGINDVFRPIIGGLVKAYRFSVYNRWGEIVFTTDQVMKGWDGRFKGVIQDGNVFAWTCMYQLEGASPRYEKGTVVIIR